MKKSRGVMGSVIDFLGLEDNDNEEYVDENSENNNEKEYEDDEQFKMQISQAINNSLINPNNAQYVDNNDYPCAQLPK